MSLTVSKIVNFPQAVQNFLVQEDNDESDRDYATTGGALPDTDFAWLACGPRLQVINVKSGCKIGSWIFGWVLKDFETAVVCVDAIQRPNGRLPLLAVAIQSTFSGGMVCIFDFITSKVIRAIQIKEEITSLHVVDAGFDVFTLPGPLRNFDGVIAVGTAGGEVYLIDICRQICDEALTTGGLREIRDELNPCQLNKISFRDMNTIEIHKEHAVTDGLHLAIHLNGKCAVLSAVLDEPNKHFTLKGPKGEDRLFVNREEVTVSALCYCPQLGSLLVGYNFGAFQLYNLMNLRLVYTSAVCDDHIPISHFAIQEPADDPRAFCYVWAIYSAHDQYSSCLPLAVLYAFSYLSKEYHEGYGFLYQDFQYSSVQYQMELNMPDDAKRPGKLYSGKCIHLSSIHQGGAHKEEPQHSSPEDNKALCLIAWRVNYTTTESDVFICLFDINQWYKEQMPRTPTDKSSATYMIQFCVSDLLRSATANKEPLLDIYLDRKSLQQFVGTQKLEEHFCPNSLSFSLAGLRACDVTFIQNHGVQKALLAQIESEGPLCLIEPAEIYHQIIGLGLVPLFVDLAPNSPVSTNQQREIILGAALEQKLIGWLCRCASEWANGSFLSAGCSLELLINWAFQRALSLKINCDKFCVQLFDYSGAKLDSNTNLLLSNCTRQLHNICSFYAFVLRKLFMFIGNMDLIGTQYVSLQMVSTYFEVLQWLLNVGLLPECPLSVYPRSDDVDRPYAPYPADFLVDFYNHRRAVLRNQNEEHFASTESVLFIDNLIERQCGGPNLQNQWKQDGGNGLYPPSSLQALLRTYLIENVDISYKHSVIIYVFLDLAMVLEEARYKPVITHLIKFPAVFKVTPSIIKLTQAFWQLDHGDYNSAMGLLLDPLIVNEDLQSWHHKVALRSLLLQKQHSFALLYIQIRKPTIKEDQDILTAISLYVANNMLDEAFYFEEHFATPAHNNKYLSHLFNEINRNDKLRLIIYRILSTKQEDFFLDYVQNGQLTNGDDLQVYYHVLRSHFLEAFDSHNQTVPHALENKGLLGKNNASSRDKLICNLKKILPDVYKNLLKLCCNEQNNVWKQVNKPTPMSFFVYNCRENVQYKSKLLNAVLAKARQTFNDSIQERTKLSSEEIPFLRTSAVSRPAKRSFAAIITPQVIQPDDEIFEPTPAKRLRLSPRNKNMPISAPPQSSALSTPIVKRKILKLETTLNKTEAGTPHGILKVRNLTNKDTVNCELFKDDFSTFEKTDYVPVTPKQKSGLSLTARKSLRTPPVVRFQGLGAPRKTLEYSTSPTSADTSADDSKSTEFYSADNSKEDSDQTQNSVCSPTVIKTYAVADETNHSVVPQPDLSLPVKSPDVTKCIEIDENDSSVMVAKDLSPSDSPDISNNSTYSPKGRRSYKKLSQSPIRTSPRFARNVQQPPADEPVDIGDNVNKAEISSPPKVVPPLRGRKSLCRQVLENNTLSRVFQSDADRTENSVQVTTREEFSEETIDSKTTFADGQSRHSASSVIKYSLSVTDIDSDLDSSVDTVPQIDPLMSDSMLDYINKSDDSCNYDKSNADYAEKSVQVTTREDFSEEVIDTKTTFVDGQSRPSASFVTKCSLTVTDIDSDLDSSVDIVPQIAPLMSDSMLDYINQSNDDSSNQVVNISDSRIDQVTDSELPDTINKIDESVVMVSNGSLAQLDNLQTGDSVAGSNQVTDNSVTQSQSNNEASCADVDDDAMDVEQILSSGSDDDKPEQSDDDLNLVYEDLSRSSMGSDLERNVFKDTDNISTIDNMTVEKKYEQDTNYTDLLNLEENHGTSSHDAASTHTRDSYREQSSAQEIIEIGSSSDDSKVSEESSASNSVRSNEDDDSRSELHPIYERNIYDTENGGSSTEYSDESRTSHCSKVSGDELSDANETTKSEGLFHGAILVIEDNSHNSSSSNNSDVNLFKSSGSSDSADDSLRRQLHSDKYLNIKAAKDEETQEVLSPEAPADKGNALNSKPDTATSATEAEASNTMSQVAEEIKDTDTKEMKNTENEGLKDTGNNEQIDDSECDDIVPTSEKRAKEQDNIVRLNSAEDGIPEFKSIERAEIESTRTQLPDDETDKNETLATSTLRRVTRRSTAASNTVLQVTEEIKHTENNEQMDDDKCDDIVPTSEEQAKKQDNTVRLNCAQDAIPESKSIERAEIEATQTKQPDDETDKNETLAPSTPRRVTRRSTATSNTMLHVTEEMKNTENTEQMDYDIVPANEEQAKEQGNTVQLNSSQDAIPESKSIERSEIEATQTKQPDDETHKNETLATSTPRRITRRSTSTSNQDTFDRDGDLKPARVLRSRGKSTDALELSNTWTSLRRTRSASVDETNQNDDQIHDRKRTRSSISHLPEDEKTTPIKKAKSTIEDYSMNRRITRKQLSLLKKAASHTDGLLEDSQKVDVKMDLLDPIVLLDMPPFEGKPDLDEKKVYDTSSNSSSSPVKGPKRRLRSASITSNLSVDSNRSTASKTKAKAAGGTNRSRPRKKSTDEISNASDLSKMSSPDKEEEPSVARSTRSRSRSISSITSEKSAISQSSRTTRAKHITSVSTLPEIKEETEESENASRKKKSRKKAAKV